MLAAALAHTFYNVLVYSDLGTFFPGKHLLTVSLWAVLGWILFRYWPVKVRAGDEVASELVGPEVAR